MNLEELRKQISLHNSCGFLSESDKAKIMDETLSGFSVKIFSLTAIEKMAELTQFFVKAMRGKTEFGSVRLSLEEKIADVRLSLDAYVKSQIKSDLLTKNMCENAKTRVFSNVSCCHMNSAFFIMSQLISSMSDYSHYLISLYNETRDTCEEQLFLCHVYEIYLLLDQLCKVLEIKEEELTCIIDLKIEGLFKKDEGGVQ